MKRSLFILGSALGIIYSPIGIPGEVLVSAGSPSLESAWRVRLWAGGSPELDAVTLSGNFSGQKNYCFSSVTGEYECWGGQYAEAEIEAYFVNEGQEQTRWNISVRPTAGWGVYEVQYPVLAMNELSANGEDRLLVPEGIGKSIGSPFDRSNSNVGGYTLKRALWYGRWPSARQAMQVLIHDDGSDAGLMLWARDCEGFTKDFTVSKVSNVTHPEYGKLHAWISHFPPHAGSVGAEWMNPYPVVTTAFDNGWFSGGIKAPYGTFAVTCSWVGNETLLERIDENKLPQWLRKNALVSMAMGAYGNATNTTLNNYLRSDLIDRDVEIAVHITQWMKYAFDQNYPEYFDPKAPQVYAPLLDMQSDGTGRIHMFPYMNMASISEDHVPYNDDLLDFSNGARLTPPIADSGWEAQSSASTGYQFGARQTYPSGSNGQYRDVFNGNNFAPMSPASSMWRSTFKTLLQKAFDGYSATYNQGDPNEVTYLMSGAHGHYLDQATRSSIFLDFAAEGFGTWYMDAVVGFLNEMRADAGLNSDKVLMGENISEATVRAVQLNYAHVKPWGDALVPLFTSVYHPYTSLFSYPIYPLTLDDGTSGAVSNFTSALAHSLHLGYKVGHFSTSNTLLALKDLPVGDHRAAFVRDAALALADAHKSLLYGERKEVPSFVSAVPTEQVVWYTSTGAATQHQIPGLAVSLWMSSYASGEDCSLGTRECTFMITNITNQNLSPIINTPLISSGTLLYRSDGGSFNYSKTAGIPIAAYSIVAVSTKNVFQ